MKISQLISTLLVFFILDNSQAQQNNYQNLFSASCFEHATYSLSVIDINSQKSIVNINDNKSLTPASSLKVISTSTSLLEFGGEYQFKTTLSYSGTINQGILNGDIIITASGDPTLGSNRFDNSDIIEELTSQIKLIGINKIKGKLILDLSKWSRSYTPLEWLWGDIGNYYGAAFSSLIYKENTYYLKLKSKAVGSNVEVIGIEDSTLNKSLSFDCLLTAANNNSDNAYILGSPISSQRRLVGTIPANRNLFKIKGSIPYPATLFLSDLKKSLSKNANFKDIQVQETYSNYNNGKQNIFYTHYSPKLKEIVKVTNLVSHNLFAETLAQQAILKIKADSSSEEFSHKPILDYWKNKGISTDGVDMRDGSGLSPRNFVTTKFMASVMAYLYNSTVSKDFIASLPTAGETGTLKSFLKNSNLSGKVHAKSGSMGSVRSYTGYILVNNKAYAFCIIVNNYSVSDKVIIPEIEKILLSLEL